MKRQKKIGVSFIIKDTSPYGLYIWDVISETLCYAASLVPEVTDDLTQIDDAMKLGYNWVQGPFELLDEIGIGSTLLTDYKLMVETFQSFFLRLLTINFISIQNLD